MAVFILRNSKKLRHLNSDDFAGHEKSNDFGRQDVTEAISCLAVCVAIQPVCFAIAGGIEKQTHLPLK